MQENQKQRSPILCFVMRHEKLLNQFQGSLSGRLREIKFDEIFREGIFFLRLKSNLIFLIELMPHAGIQILFPSR